MADSSCSLPPLQLPLLMPKHEHSVTGRPRQWHPFSGEGTLPVSFFPHYCQGDCYPASQEDE